MVDEVTRGPGERSVARIRWIELRRQYLVRAGAQAPREIVLCVRHAHGRNPRPRNVRATPTEELRRRDVARLRKHFGKRRGDVTGERGVDARHALFTVRDEAKV